MRKLTTLFLGLILLTSCGENEVDSSKLVERGGLTYEVNSETPFTGISITKNKNGKLKKKITYQNGEKILQTHQSYHPNGQLFLIQSYKDDDARTGLFSVKAYQDDGQLLLISNFKDGKNDGHYEAYHENGQLQAKGTYKDGIMDGHWVFYTKNGEKITTPQYDGKTSNEGSGLYKDGEKVSD